MIQRRRRSCFVDKPPYPVLVRRPVGAEHLQRHKTVEDSIVGEKHFAHSPGPEVRHDAIVRQQLANHVAAHLIETPAAALPNNVFAADSLAQIRTLKPFLSNPRARA